MVDQPLLSVVLPVRDGAATIGEQLDALAAQTTDDWELVVSDNGSTDATRSVVESFHGRLPAVRLVDSSQRPGLGHARNVGVTHARAELLAFCDSDDVVSPGWVEAMTGALGLHDLVGGRIDEVSLNPAATHGIRSTRQNEGLPVALHFLPYCVGANFGVRRAVVDAIGGWNDRYTAAGDDIEFSWRATLAGFRLGFAADAVVSYRYRTDLPAIRRQHFRYGAAEPRLYREFRSTGVPPARVTSALIDWLWFLRHLPMAHGSTRERGVWNRKLAYRWGRTVGSIRNRTAYL